MPMQTSINAQLGKRVGSPFTAAMINFLVGWIALLIITLIWEHTLKLPFALLQTKTPGVKEGRMPAWFLAGGLFGDLFVIGNIITAQTVGTGMAVVILLTGLMIGGLLVDQFGMFRSARRPVGWKEIAGVVIMIIGATLFYLA